MFKDETTNEEKKTIAYEKGCCDMCIGENIVLNCFECDCHKLSRQKEKAEFLRTIEIDNKIQ